HVRDGDRLATCRARLAHFGSLPAALVDELDRRASWRLPAVAPLTHGREHGPEVLALVGEPVVVSGRVLAVGHPLEHAGVDEMTEALVEHVPGDAEAALEVLEAGHAEEGV